MISPAVPPSSPEDPSPENKSRAPSAGALPTDLGSDNALPVSTDDDINRPASAAEGVVDAATLGYEPAPVQHDPYGALRVPALRYYLFGWFLMVVGGQMTALAVGVQIYERTHSEAKLGIAALMSAIPVILFSLPAGAMADRRDRRKIVLAANTGTMLLVALLAIVSRYNLHIHYIFALLFLIFTTLAFGYPARSAILPTIVPKPLLSNAVTWNSTVFQVASIAGPIVGGVLLKFSTSAPYAIHALLIGVFLLFVWKLEGAFRPANVIAETASPSTEAKAAPAPESLKARIADLTEGVRFIFGSKIIFATILLDLLAVILGGVVYVLPVFSKDILHVGEVRLGILKSGEAIGAVLMSLLIAHLPPFRRAGKTMLWAVAAFGVAVVVFGFSRNFYLSFAMLVLAGAFDGISVIVRHTLISVLAPDSMRGRINAVNTVFIGSSNELGGFRAGTMASLLGPAHSVIFGGFGTLLSVLFVTLRFKSIRQLGSLQELKELKAK